MWDYFRTLAGVSRIFQDSLGSCGFFFKRIFQDSSGSRVFLKGSCRIFKDARFLRISQDSPESSRNPDARLEGSAKDSTVARDFIFRADNG